MRRPTRSVAFPRRNTSTRSTRGCLHGPLPRRSTTKIPSNIRPVHASGVHSAPRSNSVRTWTDRFLRHLIARRRRRTRQTWRGDFAVISSVHCFSVTRGYFVRKIREVLYAPLQFFFSVPSSRSPDVCPVRNLFDQWVREHDHKFSQHDVASRLPLCSCVP